MSGAVHCTFDRTANAHVHVREPIHLSKVNVINWEPNHVFIPLLSSWLRHRFHPDTRVASL